MVELQQRLSLETSDSGQPLSPSRTPSRGRVAQAGSMRGMDHERQNENRPAIIVARCLVWVSFC